MKSLLKYLVLLIVIAALVVGILFLYSQGWIPGLQANYTVNATVILDRVQQMSTLTTTRYTFSSLVTTEREMPDILKLLYGEKQVMVAVGYITAGIDMTQIKPEGVIWDGSTLTIRLPPPALQDCFLDESASYVISRDTGLFARPAPNLDESSRRYAIEQFRNGALESGILLEAQTQAQTAVQQFIALVGNPQIRNVNISTSQTSPDAALPATCE
jgi:hypothetical protein